MPPLSEPANSLSIENYGAIPSSSSNDAPTAINNYIRAPQSQGPTGTIRMNDRISILSVAKKASCSTTTVSNVLNNKGRVSGEKRSLVLNAVRSLGYRANSAGRNLQMRRSEMVGLLFCARILKNPFYAEIMEGLEEGLARVGYHLLLLGHQASLTGSSLPDFLTRGKVDGMILLGHFPAQLIQRLSTLSTPLLLLNSNAEWPVDSVIFDGFSAQLSVVKHLASRGHRSIVLAAHEMEGCNIDLHVQGFLAGMRQYHLDADEGNIICDCLSHADIYAKLRERMKGPQPPTAVIAVNETLAMALYQRFAADNIAVPDRISIVGYDNDDAHISVGNRPFLSTVRVNKKELGRVGADLILKRIASPISPVVELRLPGEFIERDSVADLNRDYFSKRLTKHLVAPLAQPACDLLLVR